MPQPLSHITVVDLTTLAPGPMATLMLAEAGAQVTKIERPGAGDGMRAYGPRFGDAGAAFAMLNRGKKTVPLDLKSDAGRQAALTLIDGADVLVEQFRPGVMERLGLGYGVLQARNPGLIYCAITGYGADGPNAQKAGHDLNYQAEAGLLGLAADAGGAPVVPAGLLADIAGGAYPAFINILLALMARGQGGPGCRLDIAMTGHLYPFAFWAMGQGFGGGGWPAPAGGLLAGGSPRYALYRAACGRWLAVAALEQKFWETLCAAVGLDPRLRDDSLDADATRQALADIFATRPAADWMADLGAIDACVSMVATLQEAVASPGLAPLFQRRVTNEAGATLPALPVPVLDQFRSPETERPYPSPPTLRQR